MTTPISWEELIAAGRATLIPQPPNTHPADGAIRRAISTAYYAMFHALAASNAHVLIGPDHDELASRAWIRIYRGLNHSYAKSQIQQNRASLSQAAQIFADLFCQLQDERHNVDYNPNASFMAPAAATWLNKAEAAITNFLQTAPSERAAIAILTLVRIR